MSEDDVKLLKEMQKLRKEFGTLKFTSARWQEIVERDLRELADTPPLSQSEIRALRQVLRERDGVL